MVHVFVHADDQSLTVFKTVEAFRQHYPSYVLENHSSEAGEEYADFEVRSKCKGYGGSEYYRTAGSLLCTQFVE